MNIFSFFLGSKKSVSRFLFFQWRIIDGRWIAFIKRFVFQDFKVVPAVLGTIAGVATALVVTGCCWWFLFAAAKRPDSREKKRKVSPTDLHNVTQSNHQHPAQEELNINGTQDQDLHLKDWWQWCHRQITSTLPNVIDWITINTVSTVKEWKTTAFSVVWE